MNPVQSEAMALDTGSTLKDVYDRFLIRRTMERLREGLFDPLDVQLLTSGGSVLGLAFFRAIPGSESMLVKNSCFKALWTHCQKKDALFVI